MSLEVPGMPPEFGRVLAFIRAPLSVTSEAFIAWHEQLGFHPTRVALPGGLASHATELLPLENYPAKRDLLVGTAGDGWTAFFESFLKRTHPPNGASVLHNRLGVEVLEVWITPFAEENAEAAQFASGRGVPGPGLTRMEYHRPGQAPRVIALQEWYTGSSRYAFSERGPEQPWEDAENYRRRLKRDRFTPEIVARYGARIGIGIFDLDFYCGPSVFSERQRLNTVV